MLRNKIDKARGWWRKLDQPLVSELPRPVVWWSLVSSLALIVLMVSWFIFYERLVGEPLFEQKSVDTIIMVVTAFGIILLCMILDVALLFVSPGRIERHRLLRWRRDARIKGSTLSNALTMSLVLIYISSILFVFVPGMYDHYKDLKKEELVLEAMWNGTMSLEDDWLKERDITMRQYASVRQSVLDKGWESTSESNGRFQSRWFFLIVWFVSLWACLTLKIMEDVYLTWRYYRRGDVNVMM